MTCSCQKPIYIEETAFGSWLSQAKNAILGKAPAGSRPEDYAKAVEQANAPLLAEIEVLKKENAEIRSRLSAPTNLSVDPNILGNWPIYLGVIALVAIIGGSNSAKPKRA